MTRRLPTFVPVCFLCLATLATALAQPASFTWTGGGSDNNWTTAGNWGGTAPDNPQKLLNFAGSTRPLNTNNFADFAAGHQIIFNSSAAAFTLRGSAIKFFDWGGTRAKIINNSTNAQTIELRVVSGNTTGGLDLNANSGDIVYSGGIISFDDGAAGASQLRFDGNGGKTVTINNRIANGTTTASVAIRSNTIVVYTAANNSYTGGTFLDAGQLWLSTNATVAGTINLGPTAARADNASVFAAATTGGQTITNAITLRSGGSGTLTLGGLNSSGEQLFSGNVTLQKGVTLQAATGGAARFSGVISESSAGQTVTIGSAGNTGTVAFDNAMSYTGPTAINFGTLKLNAANRIADASAVTVASGATFDQNNNNETVGSIAGAGNISMGTGQLIAGGANTTTTFSGVLSGSAPGSFVKKGTGTLNFSGANAYSGSTFIVGGTLSINTTPDVGFTGTINVGETFGSDAATLAIGTGGVTVSNPITVRNGSSGVMTLAAANPTGTATFSGAITLNKPATLSANAGGNLALTGTINQDTNRLTIAATNNVTISGVIAGAKDLVKQGPGTLSLTASNTFGSSNNLFVDNGIVDVSTNGALGATEGGTNGWVNLGASVAGTAGSVTLSTAVDGLAIANPVDIRYFSAAPGAKAIAANNTSGTVTLSGPIGLHDIATISVATGGTLKLTGNIAVTNGISGSETNAGATVLFSATGPGIIKTGGGTLEVSGINSYPGETYVKNGTLSFNGSGTYPGIIRLGDNVAASTATVNLANTSGGGVVTGILNPRAGAGGTKTIAASNTSGTNVYGGGVFLDANATVLSVNAGATLAFTNNAFDVKSNTLTVLGAGDTEIRGNLTNSAGTGSLVKQGTGTLRLVGANTYGGTTTVSGGALKVNGSLGNGTVTVASGATLGGSGSIGGAVNLGGNISPGNSVGALSTGPQTWNGGASLTVEVIDAASAAGAGYDSLNVTGGIDLQATSGNPFTISLISLNGAGGTGSVTNFDNNTSYVWTLAATTGAVTNFDAGKFTLNDASFGNDLAGGAFILENGPLSLRFTNNHAPVAASFTRQRSSDTVLKIALTNLLAAYTSDADGDPVALTFAGSSTNGAIISTNSEYIFYTNANNVNDAFTYTVRDVRAQYRPGDTVRTASGTIYVEVIPAIGTNTITSFSVVGAGTNQIGFAGIPGFEYVVQFTTNMSDSPWFDLSTNVAGTNGQWSVLDDTATNVMRFYRAFHR